MKPEAKPTTLEEVLSGFYKQEMLLWMANHPGDFQRVIQLALSDHQPFAWRAAWLLWSCTDNNDQRVLPFLKDILAVLPCKGDGHQRELLKIVDQLQLDEDHEGILFDACVTIWENVHKKPSVRFHALKTILKITEKYPELAGELSFLTQDHYLEPLSGGIRNSVLRMIKGS